MLLLVLVAVGACLHTGASLSDFSVNVHSPYDPRTGDDNRLNPQTNDDQYYSRTNDNRLNPRSDDNRLSPSSHENHLNPRRNDNRLNLRRNDDRPDPRQNDDQLSPRRNDDRPDPRRTDNRLNPRRNETRQNPRRNENRLKARADDERSKARRNDGRSKPDDRYAPRQHNEAHINNGNGNGNGNDKYVCPSEFVRSGNSCYYLSKLMATWQDAHFNCKDKGAELARMEKQWEDKNMRIYLNKPELARLERWIGGIYNWESKQWVWGASGGRKLVYQGFSRRKPNANNQWHCIVMDPAMNYRWGSRSCVEHKHYLCEKRLKNLKPDLNEDTLRQRRAKRRRMNRRAKEAANAAQ